MNLEAHLERECCSFMPATLSVTSHHLEVRSPAFKEEKYELQLNESKTFCHLFPARKQVKLTIQPVYSSQPVPDGASSLLKVCHRSSGPLHRGTRLQQREVQLRQVPQGQHSPGLAPSFSNNLVCYIYALLFYSLNRSIAQI